MQWHPIFLCLKYAFFCPAASVSQVLGGILVSVSLPSIFFLSPDSSPCFACILSSVHFEFFCLAAATLSCDIVMFHPRVHSHLTALIHLVESRISSLHLLVWLQCTQSLLDCIRCH